ncbi:MAG: diguanylate cyclase [Sutterellaceae bacterium]|nr:diguanylate cyclase [Burkholderiaceae bacterium]MCX7900968.1 diguanylate cyclase [Burkholderiaceae bacterium]MDW8429990.1 diguanylate cyclase [Sutterellaceae bacterium]
MNDASGVRAAQAELVRRVLKTLAERRVIPTPQSFAEVYEELSGARGAGGTPAAVLREVLRDLVRAQRLTAAEAQLAHQHAQAYDWHAVSEVLQQALARRPGAVAANWPQMTLALLRGADQLHAHWTRARKLEAVARVVETSAEQPEVALERLTRLLESWGPALAPLPGREEPAPAEPAGPAAPAGRYVPDPALEARAVAAEARAGVYRQLAQRALDLLADSCGEGSAVAVRLRDYARELQRGLDTDRVLPRFVDAVRDLDRQLEEQRRVRESLLRLLALLTENINTLAPEETWLAGQLEPIRALLRGPLSSHGLARAESDLAAIIARQGQARRGLAETKVAIKELLATLIERIGTMGVSTGRFYDQVGGYQRKLADADGPAALAAIIEGLLADTQAMRSEIASSRAQLAAAKQKVEIYQARVRELERELSQVAALVQKDPLTQALNRRGFEEAFRVETARATRYEAPLVLALLDLDNFKKLNDSLGHVAGDRALVHFAQTLQASLRPTDLIARLGGEEFAVLLPATDVREARQAIERVREQLARSPLPLEGQEARLSFSAGVAAWRRDEPLEDLLNRADRALYTAKGAGKDRVELAAD